MSSSFNYNGYIGFWVNWDKGRILGSTLTLTSHNGAIFLAFLVVFVGFVAAQSWKIVRFLVHQHRLRRQLSVGEGSPKNPPQVAHERQIALFYQQQLVLRNEASDQAAAWTFFRLARFWSSRIDYTLAKSAPMLVLATLHAAIWVAAALFVSRVADTSSPEILLHSSNTCGYPNLNYDDSQLSQMLTVYRKVLSDMNDAWSYGESCYVDYTVPTGCMMPDQELYALVSQNATCPFPGLCMFGDTAALEIDSGLINSDLTLGINAKPSNRVNYHRVTTCAPLNTTGYKILVNSTQGSGYPVGNLVEDFDFGPDLNIEAGNVTFDYDTVPENEWFEGYQMFLAHGAPGTGDWNPIPALNRSDAEVTLVFLVANSISYLTPVDDPFFAAHYKPSNSTYYQSDNNVTVLGCIDQHEYCLPDETDVQGNPFCTGLWAPYDAWTAIDFLYNNSYMNEAQYWTAQRIAASTPWSDLYWVIGSRMSAALNASSSVIGTWQTSALPNDQWQIEVETWVATAFAYLQQTIVQYAAGQNNYDPNLVIPPGNDYEQAMCGEQTLKSLTGYISFSFLGVALIIVVGSVIFILGSAMESIGNWRWPHLRHLDDRQIAQYCRKAWTLDNNFQLQRKAFEGQLQGNWEHGDESTIPRTATAETLNYFHIDAPGPTFKEIKTARHRNSHPVEEIPLPNYAEH